MANPDYLIIGGGIVGLLSARHLREKGASVTVVDAGYAPASAVSAGILSALPPWSVDARINDLINTGYRRFFGLMEECKQAGFDCSWSHPGMLSMIYPPKQADGVYAMVRALAPHFKTKRERGFWMPEVTCLRASQFLLGVSVLAKQSGVKIVYSNSDGNGGWEFDGDKIACWRQANGNKISAGNYILCAGAHSALLCPPPKPPVKPYRGQLILYRPAKPQLCIVLDEDGMYFVPQHDGALLVGSSFEDAGFDNRPAAAVVAGMHRRAVERVPMLAQSQMLNTWSGLRPCTPNGVPIIDAHPVCRNLYLNTGHSRYGVSMADAAALHLQQIIEEMPEENPFAFYEEGEAAAA